MPLRLGTRASALARWQAEWVAAQLHSCGLAVELVPIATSGDQRQEPIGGLSGKGVFTKEIQRALLEGRIDLAVHSLKDLPTDEVPGLCLAAVPERAAAGDVLVCRQAASLAELGTVPIFGRRRETSARKWDCPPPLAELPSGAAVGTGSLRRRAQLLHARGDLQMKDVRGNVDTRLRRLDQGDYDALVLAEAGVRRLGLAGRITELLPMWIMLPAVGQGALALETRGGDAAAREAVARLDDPATHQAVLAERAMLAALQGGCLAPIAAWGRVAGKQLVLTGRVLSPDGAEKLEATRSAVAATDAAALGRRVADDLLAQGAGDLVQASRRQSPLPPGEG